MPADPQPLPSLFTRSFLAICLGSLLFLGSLFLTVPVLPLYVAQVGGSPSDVGLVVGAFTISALILRLVVGRWLDQGWQRKRLLWAGIGVFITAAVLYPFIRAILPLFLLRLYHGIGMATYSTTSTALVADSVPRARLGEAMGYYGMAATLGMAFGPALGAGLLGVASFNAVFLVSAAVVGITALVTLGIDEPPPRTTQHVPWRDLFNRRAWLPFLLALGSALSFSVIVTFLPLLVEDRQVGNAGLFFTVYSLMVLFVRVFAGRLSDRLGRARVIVPGMVLMTVAMALLAMTTTSLFFWVAAVIFGAGFGAVSPALAALAVEVVPPDQRGSAVATYTAGFELGIGFGAIAFGPVVQAAGFLVAFLLAAAGPGLGAIVFLFAVRAGVGFNAHQAAVH